MIRRTPCAAPQPARHGVARVLSKLGLASRTQAAQWVREGRVSVNGAVVRDPEFPVRQGVDQLSVNERVAQPAARVVLMLNKPRGLVTTRQDEQGRATVYQCLTDAALPWLAPVGRLDKASEGLLLFCNDPVWAASITDPASGPDKTYHVQIGAVPDAALLEKLASSVRVDDETLRFKRVCCLRAGSKNAWLEVTLDEGRNRQIRRVLEACDLPVLRLVRVAIGTLTLGKLLKGQWRLLSEQEIAAL
jgi:23S rRNA pseudouridine2605 synthase